MFYAVSEKQRERERGVCDTTHLVPVSHMYTPHVFPSPSFALYRLEGGEPLCDTNLLLYKYIYTHIPA